MPHSSKDKPQYTAEDADKAVARNKVLIEKNNKLLQEYQNAEQKFHAMLDSYGVDLEDIVELEKQIREYSTDYRLPEAERKKIQKLLDQAEIEVQKLSGE